LLNYGLRFTLGKQTPPFRVIALALKRYGITYWIMLKNTLGSSKMPLIEIGVKIRGKNWVFFVCDNGME
jgi:hypothetical protein